ncbi:MAG: 4Fe-4S binding protein, partial [Candidatus Methanoperedens sp.]|nr:4Fe-4S binding protein [Candidatus Methanoperedens sp.]
LDRAGKIKVHEVGRPSIDPEKCIQCGDCMEICPWGAIDPPRIDHSKCCGELSCADACRNEAIIPPADASLKMQKRLGEA